MRFAAARSRALGHRSLGKYAAPEIYAEKLSRAFRKLIETMGVLVAGIVAAAMQPRSLGRSRRSPVLALLPHWI
jgi:hypothetical protein